MALPSGSRLAVAELVFYVPALALSVYVNVRHGFRRQLGWFYLILLSVIRLVGNSMEVAANSKNSINLFVGAAVLNGVGLSPLLLAMLAMLKRVNKDLLHGPLERVIRLITIPILVAVILTAYGGSQLYGESSPSEYKNGENIARAGIVILLLAFGLLVLITVFSFSHLRQIRAGDSIMLYAVAISIPFILIRLIYSALVYFDTHSKTFNLTGGSIWARAFMSVLEEWVTMILYIYAGIVAPKLDRSQEGTIEMSSLAHDHEREMKNKSPPYDA
ncbi:MAG: hypothetical protein L6R41_008513 [Letrouitia leprolyta]|nr:MAG: hypothetical protein L6R41_008513 [Letrouitia leprolyta]